ncbi:hypothetical protein D3C71_2051500 [compost metagenome]
MQMVQKNVVFTKQFPDGNISKLKKSTLFPDSWSDEQILKNITDVGNTPTFYKIKGWSNLA